MLKLKDKIKAPVELNANIYNNLVKVFNDAATNPLLKQFRDGIIDLRKSFPTYAELKASGIKFVNFPVYLGENGDEIKCKSRYFGTILETKVLYMIEFVKNDDVLLLKMHGTPKEPNDA